MRTHLWRYRAQLPEFTLPAPVLSAQQEFDNQSSAVLDGIANRLEGRASAQASGLHRSFEQLNQAIATFASKHPQEALALAPRLQTFLPLCQKTENVEPYWIRNSDGLFGWGTQRVGRTKTCAKLGARFTFIWAGSKNEYAG